LEELFTVADKSSVIFKKMEELEGLLQRHSPTTVKIIHHLDIKVPQFAFRRLGLMYAQDQPIPELFTLWDAAFAVFPRIVEFFQYILAANLVQVEELLDPQDYG
jgi:hypothetical protein